MKLCPKCKKRVRFKHVIKKYFCDDCEEYYFFNEIVIKIDLPEN